MHLSYMPLQVIFSLESIPRISTVANRASVTWNSKCMIRVSSYNVTIQIPIGSASDGAASNWAYNR
jgi:hypothetical protein